MRKLNKILALLSLTVIPLTFTSCSTLQPSQSQEVVVEKSGEKMAKTIIEGFQNQDYVLFSKNFTPELKERFPKQDFKASVDSFNKRYGKLESMVPMGEMKISGMDVLFWKARFSANKNDVLIRLVLGHLDGVYKIFGWSIE